MSTKYELKNLATGKTSQLNAISGTIGPDVLDISNLTKDQGVFTFDPGFMATASTESKITYIDGDAGVLLYRGYPVEQLAEKSSFLEVATLLINGTLPTKTELDAFHQFDHAPHHGERAAAAAFSRVFITTRIRWRWSRRWWPRWPRSITTPRDIDDPRHREIFAHRIIAKLPTIAAAAYKHTLGQPFIYPRNDLRYCANMLNMFFAVPCEPYAIDPVAAEALDLLFILHADHEQNASTSTVRLAGSTGANPYAAISAGVSALWGPAHGGANEAVLDMLDGIGSVANIDKFLARVKDKNDSVRLMGFGHRVYKNFDPRAKIIRDMCYRVLEKLGKGNNPLFELALKLEEIALKDEYFVSRKLYPNVDFYSGIIYSALGIPRSMFTVMFAIARTAGWVAHWQEMVSDPHMRIGRPRQLYTGPTKRDYQPIEKR